MSTAVAPRTYKNFIDGEWIESRTGKAFENRNPANTDELVGIFLASTRKTLTLRLKRRAGVQEVAAGAGAEARRNSVSRRRVDGRA